MMCVIGVGKDASFAVVIFGNVKKYYKQSTLSSRFDYDNELLMSATVYLVQRDSINTTKIVNKTLFGKSEC
jgi:hypothetical protein